MLRKFCSPLCRQVAPEISVIGSQKCFSTMTVTFTKTFGRKGQRELKFEIQDLNTKIISKPRSSNNWHNWGGTAPWKDSLFGLRGLLVDPSHFCILLSGLLGPEPCLTCCRSKCIVEFQFGLHFVQPSSDKHGKEVEARTSERCSARCRAWISHQLRDAQTFVSFPSSSQSLQSSPVFGNPRGHPPTPMSLDQEDCHHPHLLLGICYLIKLHSTVCQINLTLGRPAFYNL